MADSSFWVRIRVLADAAGLAVATFLLAGALATVTSLNPVLYVGQDGTLDHGTATVLSCDRVGPVSFYGFGYWWKCRVQVSLSDGRQVTTTVGRSIVSPRDIGRQVPLQEQCDDNEREDCVYGRPGNNLLAFVAAFPVLIAVIVAMAGTWLTGVAAYNALLGRRRWWRDTFTPRRPDR